MTISSALLMIAASIARLLDLSDAITMDAASITQNMLLTASTTLLVTLIRVSVQGGLLIGAIWLLCRLAPRMPAAVRAGLWWIAGFGLIVGVAAPRPIALPVLPLSLAPASAAVASSLAAAPSAPAPAPAPAPASAASASASTATMTSAAISAAISATLAQDASARPAHAAQATPASPQSAKRSSFFSFAALARGVQFWPLILAGAWLGCVGWRLWRLARLRHRLAALVARGVEAPIDVQARFQQLCARVPRWQRPALRVSSEIDTPQVSGARRPVILLPAGMIARLSADELSMTLCHELTHVTRGDLWLGWIPAVARDLFFFHPLAALAAREYGVAREAACDAAVIHRLDAVPHDYGRLLVTLGVSSPRAARHAPLAAAGSASSVHLLKRRLLMLQHLPVRPGHGRAWWTLAALALVGLVPVQLVGQRHTAQGGASSASGAPGVAMSGGVAGGATTGVSGGASGGVSAGVAGGGPRTAVAGGVAGGVDEGVSGGVAGAGQTTSVATYATNGGSMIAIAGGAAGQSSLNAVASGSSSGLGAGGGAGSGSGTSMSAGAGSGFGAAGAASSAGSGAGVGAAGVGAGAGAGSNAVASGRLTLGPEDDLQNLRWIYFRNAHSTSMNGSDRDIARARAQQANADERLLWFRHDGQEYVVRDPAMLQQLDAVFKPQEELGRAQAALGERQSALGEDQSRLGEKQSELGRQQAVTGSEHARLAAVRARATARQLEAEADAAENKPASVVQQRQREAQQQMAEAERIEREISERQSALGAQQEELGRQQAALGEKQAALGQEQAKLGEKQAEAGRAAERALKTLISKALASGSAQRVR